jgi:hypothetical protein
MVSFEVILNCTSFLDYGLVDGKLEKCSRFLAETGDNHEDNEYEKYKCKHLRGQSKDNQVFLKKLLLVHGKLNHNNKCVCDEKYSGATCNHFIGCPEGLTLYNRVCAPQCRHNGTLAFSSRNVECICKAPWDGKFCDRLAVSHSYKHLIQIVCFSAGGWLQKNTSGDGVTQEIIVNAQSSSKAQTATS